MPYPKTVQEFRDHGLGFGHGCRHGVVSDCGAARFSV